MNFANAANLVPIKVAWSRILVFGWVRLVERTRIVQFAESIHVFSKLLLVFDRVDGGMVVNDALCQYLSDILAIPVERPVDVETTALGAALLAGVGAGLYEDLTHAASNWRLQQEFQPQMTATVRQERQHAFALATARANLGPGL